MEKRTSLAGTRKRRRAWGNVRKNGLRWQIRYKGPDGRERQGEQTYETEDEAIAALVELQAKMQRGMWVDPRTKALLFRTYATDWLETRDLADRTRKHYDDVLTNLILPTFGDFPIGLIRPQDVRHWQATIRRQVQERLQERVRRHRKEAEEAVREAHDKAQVLREAEATGHWVRRAQLRAEQAQIRARRALALADRVELAGDRGGKVRLAHAYKLLRAILNQAVDEDRLLERNPCTIKGGGRALSPERPYMSRTQMEVLAAAMPSQLSAAVVLTYYAHLRKGELLALKWRDIDFERGSVMVQRSASGGSEKATKTGNRREITLPSQAMAVLRLHRADVGPSLGTAPIFRHRSGTELREHHLNYAWKRATERTGLVQFHFHDLRHGGLTLVAQYGASVRHLQARAGHKTAAAAMIYQHVASELDVDLAARMSDAAPEAGQTGQALALWLRCGYRLGGLTVEHQRRERPHLQKTR